MSRKYIDSDAAAANITGATAIASGYGAVWLVVKFPMLVISLALGFFLVGVLAATQGNWPTEQIIVAGLATGLGFWWLGRQAVLGSGAQAGWLMFLGVAGIALLIGVLANNANGARIQKELNQRGIEMNRSLQSSTQPSGSTTSSAKPFAMSFDATISAAPAANVRRGPGVTFEVAYTLNSGTQAVVTCQSEGSSVEGQTEWARLADGNYVSMALIKVGPALPRC